MGKQIGLHDTMKYYSPIKNNSITTWVGVKKWLVTVVGRAYRVMPQVCGNWKLVTVKHQRHCYRDSHYKLVNCIQSEFYLNKRKCQIKIIKPSSFFFHSQVPCAPLLIVPSGITIHKAKSVGHVFPLYASTMSIWPSSGLQILLEKMIANLLQKRSTFYLNNWATPLSLKPVIQGCYY